MINGGKFTPLCNFAARNVSSGGNGERRETYGTLTTYKLAFTEHYAKKKNNRVSKFFSVVNSIYIINNTIN